MLSCMIGNKIDIIISESKLDDTSNSQFVIDLQNLFRLDCTRDGIGILLYVKNNITATLPTNYTLPKNIKLCL